MEFYTETPLALLIEQANSGDWKAASNLALMYDKPGDYPHPEIGERDEAEVKRWERETERLLELAAEGDDEDAIEYLSRVLSEFEFFRDQAEAERWGREYRRLLELAAEGGDRDAMKDLSEYLFIGDEPEGAERWGREYRRPIELAAKRGNRDAMFELAGLYSDASYLFFFDPECFAPDDQRTNLDVYWMRRAANAGHTEACRHFAKQFRQSGNPAEALKWYAKVALNEPAVLDGEISTILDGIRSLAEKVNDCYQRAEQGDPEAQFEMGHFFYQHGFSPNLEEARGWWFKAANQGHEGAIEWLKEAAEQGHEAAIEWLKGAANQGHEGAIEWIKEAAEQGHAGAIEMLKEVDE
jgi:TPR repeat protein